MPQFSVLPVQDVSLGHNHAAILTRSGVCFTMGANGHGQCGRNYCGNPDAMGGTDKIMSAENVLVFTIFL